MLYHLSYRPNVTELNCPASGPSIDQGPAAPLRSLQPSYQSAYFRTRLRAARSFAVAHLSFVYRPVCHTCWQMRSRLTARVFAALLLALTAIGAGGSTLTALMVQQTIVCASRKQRTAPRRLPERRESLTTPQAARVENPPRDSALPVSFFHLWIFQRPPPDAFPVFA